MKSLYPTLLREVETPQYGATLQSIVKLGKRGEQMETRKLVMVLNGDKQDPIECATLNVQIEGDTIVVDVRTAEQPVDEGAPAADGLAVSEMTNNFRLQGEDLDAFEMLSDFRLLDNKTVAEEGKTFVAVTLESSVYNIQDLSAVQNASLELMEKERKYLADGYKVYTVSTPRYDYESTNHFKLIETASLYKETEVASVEG